MAITSNKLYRDGVEFIISGSATFSLLAFVCYVIKIRMQNRFFFFHCTAQRRSSSEWEKINYSRGLAAQRSLIHSGAVVQCNNFFPRNFHSQKQINLIYFPPESINPERIPQCPELMYRIHNSLETFIVICFFVRCPAFRYLFMIFRLSSLLRWKIFPSIMKHSLNYHEKYFFGLPDVFAIFFNWYQQHFNQFHERFWWKYFPPYFHTITQKPRCRRKIKHVV